MSSKGVALWALCLLCVEQESVCVHPGRGPCRRVSLDAVRRAQEQVSERLVGSWEKAGRLSADQPFDSGLPACGARRSRAVRTEVPRELVGKTIGFGPADRIPAADIRVATSARRLAEIEADALADRALAERLEVRCAPVLVRILSEVELELVENP